MEEINQEIQNKDEDFDKILKPSLWAYEARTKECKAQDWRQAKKGYSIVMPMFPAYYEPNESCAYSMSVIRGSHNNSIYDYGKSRKNTSQRAHIEDQAHIENMLHLDMKVGQTLILDSKLIHRGGPSSSCDDMYFTTDSTSTTQTQINAFKNLAIHGYLRCAGDEELDMDASDKKIFKDIILPRR